MANRIAIITARGGSKRIPRKNIKDFLGKPIIAYSISAALESGLFDHVMVSTDDYEIAEIAKKYGAEVPFMRSEETANDFATTRDVLMEVLDKYKEMGVEISDFCCIYPTAPFITAEKLKEALRIMQENKAGRVVPVVRFSFPPQRCFIVDNGLLKWKFPEYATNRRSQDLEPFYHDCGQFYFIDYKTFIEGDEALFLKTYPMFVPETEVQDIDNIVDWELAEIKYQKMMNK